LHGETVEVDMLGTVQTQSIYQEGDAIIISYKQGSNACNSRRRSNSEAAVTKIKLLCGNTHGKPVYIPRKGDTDDCSFTFEWVTRVACPEKSETVPLKEGQIKDPSTDSYIDYAGLVGNRIMSVDGLISGSYGHGQYTISLGNAAETHCTDQRAAMCDHSPAPAGSTSLSVSIGNRDSIVYYMEGSVLEIHATSTTPCSTESGKFASSIIDVYCDEAAANNSLPEFLYKSISCEHFFIWNTRTVCLTAQNAHIAPVAPPHSNGARSSTVTIVITLLSLVILVSVVAVIFRKHERRAACRVRVKTLFGGTFVGRAYSYTQLSANDISEDSGLLGSRGSRIPAFEDDSDDDMIL